MDEKAVLLMNDTIYIIACGILDPLRFAWPVIPTGSALAQLAMDCHGLHRPADYVEQFCFLS